MKIYTVEKLKLSVKDHDVFEETDIENYSSYPKALKSLVPYINNSKNKITYKNGKISNIRVQNPHGNYPRLMFNLFIKELI